MLFGVVMLLHKGASQEFQWINIWDISAISDILTTGKDIFCLGVDVFGIRVILPYHLPHLTIK